MNSSRAIKDFLAEAEEIIEKLNLDLVHLGECGDSGECDPELLNGIFRGAHSLKGLAGMFSFDDISELAHRLENLLDSLRLGKINLSGELVELLFDGLEMLTRLVYGKGENGAFTLDTSPLTERLDKFLKGGERGESRQQGGIDPEVMSVLTEYEEHRLLDNIRKKRTLLRVRAVFSLLSFDQDLAEISDLLKNHGEIISTLPSAGDFAEQISFQIIFGTGKTSREISDLLGRDNIKVEFLLDDNHPQAAIPNHTEEKDADVEAPPAAETTIPQEGMASVRSISHTVRVDIEKLDALMNIVGELVLAKGAITEIFEQLKLEGDGERGRELQKATRNLERRLDELQKGVMEVRMVPVGQLFEKMTRIVRRVASERDKKVTLDILGGETELDKLIMESLSDPLMHIIRNAIDHGIESAAERLAAGKPEKGKICLWASQKGNHVVIEVRDDGRGIDPAKIRRTAIKRGLIGEHSEMSREDMLDLIFLPGFSTSDQVSDLSGRGVGMDVVKTNIGELSGMIDIDSQLGLGTLITITLPITLAIIKALIIRVCGQTYAIPVTSVMETLMIEQSAIRTVERREVLELRQMTLPLLRLGDIFQLPQPQEKTARPFVTVVGMAEKKLGIVVDELLGQQDVVIKSIGKSLSFIKGIAGAADLGNQKTILVLDVGGLMNEAVRGDSAIYV
ncbi:MAG: chemotaxis protein CheA [Desulfuromonadales bacterium]